MKTFIMKYITAVYRIYIYICKLSYLLSTYYARFHPSSTRQVPPPPPPPPPPPILPSHENRERERERRERDFNFFFNGERKFDILRLRRNQYYFLSLKNKSN